MGAFNSERAERLVEKSRSYGTEPDAMTDTLADAITYIKDVERQLSEANRMIAAMLRMEEYQRAHKA